MPEKPPRDFKRLIGMFAVGFLFAFLPLFCFVVSQMPDELSFLAKAPSYTEFLAYPYAPILKEGVGYTGHGFDEYYPETGPAPQLMKIKFYNGGRKDSFVLQPGYKPTTFELHSDIAYTTFLLFEYRIKAADFLVEFQAQDAPKITKNGFYTIQTQENGIRLSRGRTAKGSSFTFTEIRLNKRVAAIGLALFVAYSIAVFLLWKKQVSFAGLPLRRNALSSALAAFLLFLPGSLLQGISFPAILFQLIGYWGLFFVFSSLYALFFPKGENALPKLQSKTPPKRIVYFDILRLICAFGVIQIHVSAWILRANCSDILTLQWTTIHLLKCLLYCVVYVFFMMSGALLLNSETPNNLKKLYTRNIWRILVALFVWDWIYLFFTDSIHGNALITLCRYHGPLWFLAVILVLYVMSPFLKKIASDRKTLLYTIVAGFILVFGVNSVNETFPNITVINDFFKKNPMKYFGPVVYFLTGYYLFTTELSPRVKKWIYFVGGTAIVLNWLNLTRLSLLHKTMNEDNISIFLACWSMTLFIAGKDLYQGHAAFFDRHAGKMETLAKMTFGIFLCHDIFIRLCIDYVPLGKICPSPLLAMVLFTVLIFAVCTLITYLLQKIPWARKNIT